MTGAAKFCSHQTKPGRWHARCSVRLGGPMSCDWPKDGQPVGDGEPQEHDDGGDLPF